MSVLVPILIIFVLIAANAFFVAAEFAIVAVPRPVIQRRAAEGGIRAKRVQAVLAEAKRVDRYIATAALGISVASLGLGMYGESVLARLIEAELMDLGTVPTWIRVHALASVVAIALLTFVHIVLGEMVPKAISLSRAEKAALWLTPIMGAIQGICFPLIVALNGFSNVLLRLVGIRRTSGGEHYYSQEELQYVVRESEEGGLLPTEQAQVLDELLEFGDLTAREAMVPRVRIRGLRLGAGLDEVVALVKEELHTRYPVHAGDLDHIVGTIHIKDILRRFREGRRVLQADVHAIPFVPETMTLDEVFRTMRDRRAQMVVVMDEHGGTGGLLTIEDLFEEIIGDIDESQEQPEIAEENGALLVLGTVRLEEIGEHYDLQLEHEEVDSVSGLVLGLLGRPPRIGDRVEWRDFGFEVLEVEGLGVGRVRVTHTRAPQAVEGQE
jgi:CBS domain containing-hemolysin-like protein